MTDDEYESPPRSKAEQSIPVYPAYVFTVVNGANLGDAVSISDELSNGDVYMLSGNAPKLRLSLRTDAEGFLVIASGTECGNVDALVFADSTVTLMSPDGVTTEALILVELDIEGHVAQTFLLPLSRIYEKTEYSLVGVDPKNAREKLAQVACVSFARGTHITLSTGEQRRIEDLRIGDKVLTRDDGAQAIRWIGQSTVRANGPFAPILIRKGAMHNDNDLIVSPDHRLFVYQRADRVGVGRAELLIKARYLVNGDTVVQSVGGFVDYFQLLFDHHQIIYAEGIAAESLLVDNRNRAALPDDLADALREHAISGHLDLEVQEKLLQFPDVAEVLRKASTTG